MGQLIADMFQRKSDHLILGRRGPFPFSPRFSVSPKVRRFHSYVVGLTGRGKSKFLQNCIVQDVQANRGVAVIDPHGDLAKDVLKSLIDNGHFSNEDNFEKILYVSPRRRDFVMPFNVLKRPTLDTETYEISQRVIAAFQRTWATTLAEPPRFQQIMRASLAVLIENEKTLCDLYQLLTDDDFRHSLIANISDSKVALDCSTFFDNEFERWGRDQPKMMSSTTNKISALTDNPSLFYMLGQNENAINIREIMDQGKVLLVDLGDCDQETKKLFGTLMVTGFEQAALSRARSSFNERTPFYLYVDEFQDFACHPGAADTFSQMLSQVRKFGLHMILANQSLAQLSPRLQTALGNAQTIASFRVSRDDAESLARMMGEVDTQEVKRASQSQYQHPVYSPISEQREIFIQSLTNQAVRQVTVKTADDQFGTIWPELIKDSQVTDQQLEEIIKRLLKISGKSFEEAISNFQYKPEGENRIDFYT